LKNRIVLFVVLLGTCAEILAQPIIGKEVVNIIALTRETQSTYAAYFWNAITREGEEPVGEWSAEFHSGNLHRVETPRDRIIADCKAMTGTYLVIETGELIEGPEVAKAACGINANQKIISKRKLANVRTQFGEASRIEINDSEFRRTYDVSKESVLLAGTMSDAGKDGKLRMINKATHVSRLLPKGDIFSVVSLYRSVVAEKFKRPIK
jgi:hypothetical protein